MTTPSLPNTFASGNVVESAKINGNFEVLIDAITDGNSDLVASSVAAAFAGDLTGNVSGSAATVTGSIQSAITACTNLAQVGALNAGSVTSGFVGIDIGTSTMTCGPIIANSSTTAAEGLMTPNTQPIGGNKTFDDFTAFGNGNTSIKVKVMSSATRPGGASQNIAHGLDSTKIMGVTGFLERDDDAGLWFGPGNKGTSTSMLVVFDETNVTFTDCGSLLDGASAGYRIVIIYIE